MLTSSGHLKYEGCKRKVTFFREVLTIKKYLPGTLALLSPPISIVGGEGVGLLWIQMTGALCSYYNSKKVDVV